MARLHPYGGMVGYRVKTHRYTRNVGLEIMAEPSMASAVRISTKVLFPY